LTRSCEGTSYFVSSPSRVWEPQLQMIFGRYIPNYVRFPFSAFWNLTGKANKIHPIRPLLPATGFGGGMCPLCPPSGSAPAERIGLGAKGVATFQKMGVSTFPSCPYKRSYNGTTIHRLTRSVEGRGIPSRLGNPGERRQLPQRGLEARSPNRKRILFWGVSCTILCDFTHLLAHATAAWKWETYSYIPSVAAPDHKIGQCIQRSA